MSDVRVRERSLHGVARPTIAYLRRDPVTPALRLASDHYAPQRSKLSPRQAKAQGLVQVGLVGTVFAGVVAALGVFSSAWRGRPTPWGAVGLFAGALTLLGGGLYLAGDRPPSNNH